jgi:uncharacterized LabA/DUF88 family protein
MPPIHVNVYIDGLNVYHRINKWRKDNPKEKEDYRWLDYHKAIEKMLKPPEVLQGICFFTAIGKDTGAQNIQRHQTFIDALQAVGVETVYGKFLGKGKNRKEKQTDINIAARVLTDAANNEFDRFFFGVERQRFCPLA